MKEAAGEANMTVITIILIGIIAAVAYPMIDGLVKNQQKKAECLDKGYDENCQVIETEK